MKNKLTVAQQVPEFVRSEYPAFVEFLQAYYEWFEEEYSTGRLSDLTNLDTTVDEFLQYFRKQLDVHGVTANTTDRFYIKNLKELYTSKGSPAAAEFLFKILYDTTSTVTQPWDSVIKASQAEWKQDVSILTSSIDSTTAATMVGNKIIITDASGYQYTTFVTDMSARNSGIIELFINRITPRDTITSFVSYDQTVSGNILTSIVGVEVTRSGSGFKPGQVFQVSTDTSIDSSLVKVKGVDSKGSITAVDVATFGAGYTSDFSVNYAPDQDLAARRTKSFTFNPNTAVTYSTGEIGTSTASYFTTGDKVTFYKGGAGYNSIPGATGSDGVVSSGILNNNTYYVMTGATSVTTVKMSASYSDAINGKYIAIARGSTGISNTMTFFASDYATLKFKTDNLCIYKGKYQSGFDIIGDAAYLQDSYFYQIYSYVTSLNHSIDSYGALLKRVIHPIGTKHFANLQITNAFQLNLDAVTLPPSVISKVDIRYYDTIRDFVETLTFAVRKALADSAPITEQLIVKVSKVISDTVATPTETCIINVTKVVSDAINTPTETTVFKIQPSLFDNVTQFNETTTFHVGARLADSTNVGESSIFNVSKTTTGDQVFLSENFTTSPSLSLTDNFSISDNITRLTIAKYITEDAIALTNSGTIYGGPFYTETPYITPYWENGYLQNEGLITN